VLQVKYLKSYLDDVAKSVCMDDLYSVNNQKKLLYFIKAII